MEFRKIGIAFCIGLFEEAKLVAEVFERRGFEVFSVACKVGAIDKSELNLKKLTSKKYNRVSWKLPVTL
jgi:uncharacterized metal-binding protein